MLYSFGKGSLRRLQPDTYDSLEEVKNEIESDQYSGSGVFTSINFPSLSVNVISVSICIISSVLYSAHTGYIVMRCQG